MKNKLRLTCCLSLLLLSANFTFGQATVKLEANDSAPTINKNIYGHFAEHLGRCIYDGLYVGEKVIFPIQQACVMILLKL